RGSSSKRSEKLSKDGRHTGSSGEHHQHSGVEPKMKLPYGSEAFRKANPRLFQRVGRRDWEDRELEIIRACCSDPELPIDIGQLAESLGRSHASVALKISRLGLGNFSRKKTQSAIESSLNSRRLIIASMSEEERGKLTAHLPKDGSQFKGRK